MCVFSVQVVVEPVDDIERCSDLCLEPVSPEDLEKLVRELCSWSVHTPQPNTSPQKENLEELVIELV